MEIQHIGNFNVQFPKLFIGDPAYNLGSAGSYIVNQAYTGLWKASLVIDTPSKHVSRLVAVHFGFTELAPLAEKVFNEDYALDVDCGLMSVCDLSKYTDIFFSQCDDLMQEEEYGALVQDYGVVCSSGWGDGTYPLYLHSYKSGVYGIIIDFQLEDVF